MLDATPVHVCTAVQVILGVVAQLTTWPALKPTANIGVGQPASRLVDPIYDKIEMLTYFKTETSAMAP